MYPFIRMATTMLAARNAPPLPVGGRGITRHMAMPWDLDVFGEVNNGRLLSLYDLGRFSLAVRVGLREVTAQTHAAISTRIEFDRRVGRNETVLTVTDDDADASLADELQPGLLVVFREDLGNEHGAVSFEGMNGFGRTFGEARTAADHSRPATRERTDTGPPATGPARAVPLPRHQAFGLTLGPGDLASARPLPHPTQRRERAPWPKSN